MTKRKQYPIKRKVEDKGHALQQQTGTASFLLTHSNGVARVLFVNRRQLSANSENRKVTTRHTTKENLACLQKKNQTDKACELKYCLKKATISLP
jgi:hypothetical protein